MAPPAPKRGGLHLPGGPVLWIGGLAVLAVGGYLLWRRRQANSAAATTAADPTSATDTSTTDPSALGTLQTEIGDLQSSDAGQKVQVPNVVGKTQSAAFGIISSAGLRPSGATVEPGKTLYVTAQSPGAGALTKVGSTVNLQSSVRAPARKPPAKKPVTKTPQKAAA